MGGSKKYSIGEELCPGLVLNEVTECSNGQKIYIWRDKNSTYFAHSPVEAPHMLQWTKEYIGEGGKDSHRNMLRWGKEMEAQIEAEKVNASSTPDCLHIRPKVSYSKQVVFAVEIAGTFGLFIDSSTVNAVVHIGNTSTRPNNLSCVAVKKGDVIKVGEKAFIITQTTNMMTLFETTIG